MKMSRILGSTALMLALAAGAGAAEEPMALLKASPRIVVLGDSITYGGDYVTDFACWLLSRGMTNEVLNLGLSSETATDLTEAENADHLQRHKFGRPLLSERLERVLAGTKPDLVIACYGMNDGGSLPAGEAGTKRFMQAIENLRAAAGRHGAKAVIHLTPPVQDAGPGKEVSAHDVALAAYSRALLARRADGWRVADIHGPMREALDARRRSEPAFKFAGDGVHPNREGHWLMAQPLIRYFGDADAAGRAKDEDLFAGRPDAAAIRALVHQRMCVLRDAWLTATKHTRPGVKAGLPLDEAAAKARELTAQIAAKLASAPSASPSPAPAPAAPAPWNGFAREDFTVGEGKTCSVISPAQPLPGKLWAWKGEFLDAFPGTEIALLKRGVYIVYLRVPSLLGAPEAVRHWDAAYAELTGPRGMAKKPALIGLSRGGLYCYNWASAHPDRVACVYGDAPVCDLKSWPGGKGKGKGSPGDWQLAMKVYGFKDEAAALAFRGNPVDQLKPLADAHVPLMHVYGDADDVVPWEENTKVIADRYRALGGSIELIGKPGVGHHPHGLPDPTPVADFIVKSLKAANGQ